MLMLKLFIFLRLVPGEILELFFCPSSKSRMAAENIPCDNNHHTQLIHTFTLHFTRFCVCLFLSVYAN